MAKIPTANITATPAAGSTESPYVYSVNISQRLCFPTCVGSTPVFAPKYSLVGISLVQSGLYMATIHVEGIISYVPCNGGCCDMKAQPLSQDFSIPISSTTAPTVTLAQGATANAIIASGCQSCSRQFVSETPLTITVG